MLTGRIDKFNHKSTIQREVKLDTGEFDPRHQLVYTSFGRVRDDCLLFSHSDTKRNASRWGGMSVKIRDPCDER